MIQYSELYKEYIKTQGVGAKDRVSDSIKSYISYLRGVCNHLCISISPKTLKSKDDMENLSQKLKGRVSDKTIKNYRSAMRHYICMVKINNLT